MVRAGFLDNLGIDLDGVFGGIIPGKILELWELVDFTTGVALFDY